MYCNLKRNILFIVIQLTSQLVFSQINTTFFPQGNALNQVRQDRELSKSTIIRKLPPYNYQKLLPEDKENKGLPVPFRFGKGFDINVTLVDGEWTEVDGGGRLWSMEFQSEGAYSLNFVFDRFYLPASASLYIVNADETVMYGPVTSMHNTKNGYFLTDLIKGDAVTIYLFEPAEKKGESQLTIRRVVHAYKNIFPELYGNLGSSLSCNNDINCFPDWDEESDAVALVLLANGTEWCSGSLLMTADQTFEPYILSAFHCVDRYRPYGNLSSTEISDAENWLFKFQYKMALCGGTTATTGVTYNGATFRAAWNTTDFVLMEMDNSPVGDTRFSWLGWDRSGDTPGNGTGIHHPSGDVMKISFDYNNLNSNSSQINWYNGTVSHANTHWMVGFDNGTTEGGSSGSPLFDQSKRVVGQLHGGQSGCPPVTKYYGQFYRSWTGGGTDDTRLSNWLDPCGTGTVTTNTSRAPSISGPTTVCSSGATFTLNNLPQSVNSIVWTHGPNLAITAGQNSVSCSFSALGNGDSWIRATLTTDCGEILLPKQTVWAGSPWPTILLCPVNNDYPGSVGPSVACGNTGQVYWLYAHGANLSGNDADYRWKFSSSNPFELPVQAIGRQVEYGNDLPGNYTVSLQYNGECGWSNEIFSNICIEPSRESEFYLSLSPNPASHETILAIESTSPEKTFDETVPWDVEVYSEMQVLRSKQSGLRGQSTQIHTAGMKEGIYIVRVNYNPDGKPGGILTAKLVVKR